MSEPDLPARMKSAKEFADLHLLECSQELIEWEFKL